MQMDVFHTSRMNDKDINDSDTLGYYIDVSEWKNDWNQNIPVPRDDDGDVRWAC
jgi:hypothetical protein